MRAPFDAVADTYDATEAAMFDPAVVGPAVDVLAELAGGEGGAALELGIGTGRVAQPRAARGVRVHGVDESTGMVARLRAKPGGDRIDVTVGDFATTRLGATFDVAYLVFNTIMNLTTQDAQVECFRTVASHLGPGGAFVVEVGVPPLRELPPGATAVTHRATATHVDVDTVEPASQRLTSHHLRLDDDGCWRRVAVPFRYVWPAELDLMARLAGLRLRHRWAGWDRSAFGDDSAAHVSVWERPAS